MNAISHGQMEDKGAADGSWPSQTDMSARAHVRQQLEALILDFGLEAKRQQVLATYDGIFHKSLDFPLGNRPPAPSRLTEDGTPIQFATAVGTDSPSLRFVGDAGPLNAGGAQRMHNAHAVIETVAELLGTQIELDTIRPLLSKLAPETNRLLLANPSGAFWIGAAFTPNAEPRLRIYINASWDSQTQRQARMDTFAAAFGQTRTWKSAQEQLPQNLAPLGMALTLSPGRQATGALYYRGFGLRLNDYACLAESISGSANAKAVTAFGTDLLGKEASYPTASAALSFGFRHGSGLTTDLEFCAHCLFRDDAEAQRRLLKLFATAGLESLPYKILSSRLMARPADARSRHVHSFIGLDGKSARPKYTVYMKPDLTLPS